MCFFLIRVCGRAYACVCVKALIADNSQISVVILYMYVVLPVFLTFFYFYFHFHSFIFFFVCSSPHAIVHLIFPRLISLCVFLLVLCPIFPSTYFSSPFHSYLFFFLIMRPPYPSSFPCSPSYLPIFLAFPRLPGFLLSLLFLGFPPLG